MTVEVVIPSLRQEPVERLATSLALQSELPSIITIVSNETQPFLWPFPVAARLLRFKSDDYGVGDLDVALRQNAGLFASTCDYVVIQGDDQVAPYTMIEDCLERIAGKRYIWGNHHLTDFDGKGMEEIRATADFISRENPAPPAWHGYQSCYGGMFCAENALVREVGGFDMAFNGRHGSEDQQLGFRLLEGSVPKVWIDDPPFSWHPIELRQGDTRTRSPWLIPIRNGCDEGQHQMTETYVDGVRFQRCGVCPVTRFNDEHRLLFRRKPIMPYRPELVRTTSVWL